MKTKRQYRIVICSLALLFVLGVFPTMASAYSYNYASYGSWERLDVNATVGYARIHGRVGGYLAHEDLAIAFFSKVTVTGVQSFEVAVNWEMDGMAYAYNSFLGLLSSSARYYVYYFVTDDPTPARLDWVPPPDEYTEIARDWISTKTWDPRVSEHWVNSRDNDEYYEVDFITDHGTNDYYIGVMLKISIFQFAYVGTSYNYPLIFDVDGSIETRNW